MFKLKLTTTMACMLLFAACGKSSVNPDNTDTGDTSSLPGDKTTWWQPKAGVSFDWGLDDITAADNFDAGVVDVDAFTTSAETVAALHAKGKKVIAYISAGTLEKDRPDGSLLPKEVIGKVYPEWPDERWLDIRQLDKLKPWLNSRFAMIVKKGFDGVEPDNMDSYTNETGFAIKRADVERYADYLIQLAHSNGLSIGQKNVSELTPAYAAKFDWALAEDAFDQGWQNDMAPFIKLNKPVFAVEYTDVTKQKTFDDTYCPKAKAAGFTAILKRRNLSKWMHGCQ